MKGFPCHHCKEIIPMNNVQQGGCHMHCFEDYYRDLETKGFNLIVNVVTRSRVGMPYKVELDELMQICKKVPSVKKLIQELITNLERQ